jgi:hypothetical protein
VYRALVMLRGVEGEFDDRTRAAESQNVDVRAVHRVYEDRYSPLCQFRQHRLEGRMAEVTPKHVRGQRHSVEPQFVQGVREFRQRLVGTVRGQRGEGSEPVGVHRDQVGVPFVDHPGQADSELRVVVRPRERHRHGHELGGDLLPVHIGERGVWGSPHRYAVAAGRLVPPPPSLPTGTTAVRSLIGPRLSPVGRRRTVGS